MKLIGTTNGRRISEAKRNAVDSRRKRTCLQHPRHPC